MSHLGRKKCIREGVPVFNHIFWDLIDYRLIPKGSNKIFRFKSNSEQYNLKEWVDTIKIHIDYSEGQKNDCNKLIKINKFWKVFIFLK